MKNYLVIIFIFFCKPLSFAQQGFVAVGADASGNGSASYSVGQLDYNFYSNGNNLIIEGLQQPFEISKSLPISLLYFTARKGSGRTVLINWSTVSEYNNDYFTIERSVDGILFVKMAETKSKGNSNSRQEYTITDFDPYDGYSYYRLKQTDKDGKFTYSPIERVFIGNVSFDATAGPNPTVDMVQLHIAGNIDQNLEYRLTDLNGKKLAAGKIVNSTTTINLSKLAQAPYLLQLVNGQKVIKTFKIIKK